MTGSPSDDPNPSNDNEPRNDSDGMRPLIAVLVVLFGVFFILAIFQPLAGRLLGGDSIDFGYLWKQAEAGNVDTVVFKGEQLTGTWKSNPPHPKIKDKKLSLSFEMTIPPNTDIWPLIRHLYDHGAEVRSTPQAPGLFQQFLVAILPILLMIGFFYYMMRRGGDPFSSGFLGNFIRSPAKRFRSSDKRTTFDDVAAMDQAKLELQEIVEFLKNPVQFQRLGAQIPKGVLLIGPPGTGKTLLARATAGEAGVPFFAINGSEFIQMFVGVGASRVRDMFRNAKENSPAILFIDEIDAVGRIRGAGLGGGHDEREQTLNQILSEMDGFQQTEAVIVVAATNRPDVLDPALLRPGRFDRHVTVDRPSKKGREAILKVHVRKVPLAETVNLAEIAAGTIGFSGAELKNLVNEAALNATRYGKDSVETADFDSARDKVLMGPKRDEILTRHEREMTAYHEAGHALLAWFLPDVDPVYKVSIIPRGRSLGVTQFRPSEERYSMGERRLHSQLAMALGGRAAEKLQFDEYCAGAEDDLKRATQTARRMVAYWGMSEAVGPVAFRHGEEHPFLGKEIHEQRDFSEETARMIDEEVQHFLQRADAKARQVLNEHRDKLKALAEALLKDEELGQDEITALIGPPVPRTDAVPEILEA